MNKEDTYETEEKQRLVIITSTPGILIGRMGLTHDAIKDAFGKEVLIFEDNAEPTPSKAMLHMYSLDAECKGEDWLDL